jgi:hypothetical protein
MPSTRMVLWIVGLSALTMVGLQHYQTMKQGQ